MSENDLSHIDTVADSAGFDMCQYLWVVRVYIFFYFFFFYKVGLLSTGPTPSSFKLGKIEISKLYSQWKVVCLHQTAYFKPINYTVFRRPGRSQGLLYKHLRQ